MERGNFQQKEEEEREEDKKSNIQAQGERGKRKGIGKGKRN